MNANTPLAPGPSPAPAPGPSPAPTTGSPAPAPSPKRHRWFLYGCGSLLALLLLICATVAITLWYIQRPIKPVVLTPQEKATVDAKIDRLSGGSASANNSRDARTPRSTTQETRITRVEPTRPAERVTPLPEKGTGIQLDPVYEPGAKTLRLTDREINGLLNANTDLGNTVRLEFGRDAINAYIVAPIPDDVPVFGGKMFRARGRFRLSVVAGAAPVAVLEDLTIFGLSLPNAWLGGIKGENLLADALGKKNGGPVLRGIKNLRIEPGVLTLEVED